MNTVEDVLAHFGVKGMRWGVTRKGPGGTSGPGRKVQVLNRKIDANESLSKASRARAKLHQKDLDDLEKNGLQSAPMQKKYGRDLLDNNFVFASVHKMSKNNALEAMKSETRHRRDVENAVADRADVRASKLKKKRENLEHSDVEVEEDESIDDILAHFGVKGMKWGVRRAEKRRTASSDDAKAADDARAKVKKAGGTHALTNKELQDLVTRMNLERQFNTLKPDSKKKVAAKFVADILVGAGKQQAQKLAQDQIAKQVATLLKK